MAEVNTKKQQLTYHKGITNSPSDYVCSDNELADEVGMIFNGSEHQPIQNPKLFKTFFKDNALRLVCTHFTKSIIENYILYDELLKILYYTNNYLLETDDKYIPIMQFIGDDYMSESHVIGNTLIVKTSDNVFYFLWEADSETTGNYTRLGDKIPEPSLRFALAPVRAEDDIDPDEDSFTTDFNASQVFADIKTTDILKISIVVDNYIYLAEDKVKEYSDAVIGGYSENKKSAASRGCFINPFMIRYALELYDGSYIYASEPIVLYASLKDNTHAQIYKLGDGDVNSTYIVTMIKELVFKMSHANGLYDNWRDIVSKIVIFASPEVDIYDTSIDQKLRNYDISDVNGVTTKRLTKGTVVNSSLYVKDGIVTTRLDRPDYALPTTYIVNLTDVSKPYKYFYPLVQRSEQAIAKDMEGLNNFYKIIEIDATTKYAQWTAASKHMEKFALVNLESQQRLPDDYFSHCKLYPSSITTYNNRVHYIAPKRSFYTGGQVFVSYENSSLLISQSFNAYVYIKTPSGKKIVKNTIQTRERLDYYFYYPDPRAYKVKIFLFEELWYESELKKHPYLNGAYYLRIPTLGENPLPDFSGSESDVVVNITPEYLPNQIFTSEVNNPFVFKAEGNNALDVQNIIGIATTTTALSQGQFGQYPMIVFTNDGIWAMQTNAEGFYTSIVPLSREVCNNPKSITQTDGAVFFSSEKGLMVIVGSEVKCVSEQLNGKYTEGIEPLQNILKNSGLIAYDYRDSLLWILDDTTGTIYIYNIKAGAFAQFKWQGELLYNVVNHYPDTLLQDKVGNVYSLLSKPNINSDVFDTYEASIETRPMKLEDAFAFKSLRQLKNVFDSDGGSCSLKIEASNDMKNWTEITSLKGKGWKYFKFKYEFANMKATDRFAGTILVTQQRFDNKLR